MFARKSKFTGLDVLRYYKMLLQTLIKQETLLRYILSFHKDSLEIDIFYEVCHEYFNKYTKFLHKYQ